MIIDTLKYTISPYSITLIASIIIGFAVAAILLVRSKIDKMIIVFSVMINTTLLVYFGLIYTVISNAIYKSGGLGFSSMGGMMGVLLGSFIMYAVTKKTDIIKSYSAILPLVYSISKLGCFFVGCCGGKEYRGPLAVTYLGNMDFIMPYPTFPVPLLESVCFALIFIIVMVLYSKLSTSKHIALNVLICAAMKFGLDYLRISHVGQILSMNQIACMITVICMAVIMIIISRKKLIQRKV